MSDKVRYGLAKKRSFRPTLEQLETRTVPTGYLITGATPGFPSQIQSFAADNAGMLNQASLQSNAPLPGSQAQPLQAAAVAAGDLNGDGVNDTLAYVTRSPGGTGFPLAGVPFVFIYKLNADGSLGQ